MKIIPVSGRTVRHPETGREITEPTDVPNNDTFWIRRLADGDVALEKTEPDYAKPKSKGAE